MFTRILVPTDGSDLANQSAANAIQMAKALSATVVAVSILQPLASIPFYEGVGIAVSYTHLTLPTKRIV